MIIMRSFIISIILLLVLAGSIFGSLFVLNKEIDSRTHELDIIYSDVQSKNWDDAKEKIENFKESLEKKKFLLSAFVEHIDHDALLTQTELTGEYIKKEVEADSLAQIKSVKYLLVHIKDKNGVTWENIL